MELVWVAYATKTGFNGNVLRTADSHAWTANFEYDALNRLTASHEVVDGQSFETAGANQTITTTYSYYADGREQTVTRPNSEKVTYEFDAAGNLTKMTQEMKVGQFNDIETQTTYYQDYDGNGNYATIVNPSNETSSFTYDALGRLTKESIGITDSGEKVFEYDAFGNLIRVYNREYSQTLNTDWLIAYQYDHVGNLAAEKWGDRDDWLVKRFEYTPLGEISSAKVYRNGSATEESK